MEKTKEKGARIAGDVASDWEAVPEKEGASVQESPPDATEFHEQESSAVAEETVALEQAVNMGDSAALPETEQFPDIEEAEASALVEDSLSDKETSQPTEVLEIEYDDILEVDELEVLASVEGALDETPTRRQEAEEDTGDFDEAFSTIFGGD